MANNDDETRECPYCKETIAADATKCSHCRSAISPESPGHGGVCPYCKEEVNPEATKCPHCESYIGADQGMASGEISRQAVLRSVSGSPERTGMISEPGDFLPDAPISESAEAASIGPDGPSIGEGGELSAWGCWDSTCCVSTGLCQDRFGRYYRCCLRRVKCKRCIWPW